MLCPRGGACCGVHAFRHLAAPSSHARSCRHVTPAHRLLSKLFCHMHVQVCYTSALRPAGGRLVADDAPGEEQFEEYKAQATDVSNRLGRREGWQGVL